MPYDFGSRDAWGSKESLGNKEAERDIQSLRRRKRKVAKKDRGFASGIHEKPYKTGGRSKGFASLPKSKSKGGHKLPRTGFGADMVGVKEKTWKMGSII